MRSLAILVLAAAPATARAAEPPRNAISIQPLAFASDGVAVQYERFMRRRWSVVAGPAVRFGAGGDYSSFHAGLGAEVRYWILGEAPLDDWARPAMVGPFVAARLDLSWMTLSNDVQNRTIGSLVTLAEGAWLGYRLTAFEHVELSLLLGGVVRHEIDPAGRLAAYTRPALGFGLTLGWMF